MEYIESPPSPRYASRIRCFWAIRDDSAGGDSSQPVLPDGCPELIFNLSDRFKRFKANKEIEIQPRTIVSGQLSGHILIGPSGKVDLFGARFHPAGAFGVFRFPLSHLRDRIECLGDIWIKSESEVHEKLAEAGGFTQRIEIFERFLDSQNVFSLNGSSEIEYAVGSLERGSTSVNGLARELGWSERRLERRFNEQVGVSPKLFSRINRFQRLIRRLESGAVTDLAGTAIECGFYDQPHMNREFVAFAGTSPTAFLETSHRMSEFFVGGE